MLSPRLGARGLVVLWHSLESAIVRQKPKRGRFAWFALFFSAPLRFIEALAHYSCAPAKYNDSTTAATRVLSYNPLTTPHCTWVSGIIARARSLLGRPVASSQWSRGVCVLCAIDVDKRRQKPPAPDGSRYPSTTTEHRFQKKRASAPGKRSVCEWQ